MFSVVPGRLAEGDPAGSWSLVLPPGRRPAFRTATRRAGRSLPSSPAEPPIGKPCAPTGARTSRRGPKRRGLPFGGVALTPGASGGIPQTTDGRRSGEEGMCGHAPTSPVVSPEGFPAFGSPRSASRAGAPTSVPGPRAGRRRRSAFCRGFLLAAFGRPAVRRSAGRPNALRCGWFSGRRRRPGVCAGHGLPAGRTQPPPTTPATIAHSLPRPGRSGGPSYRRVGCLGASGASRAKRRGLRTVKHGIGTCIPAILRSL